MTACLVLEIVCVLTNNKIISPVLNCIWSTVPLCQSFVSTNHGKEMINHLHRRHGGNTLPTINTQVNILSTAPKPISAFLCQTQIIVFLRGAVSLISREDRQSWDLNRTAEHRLLGISLVSCATQPLLPIIAPAVARPCSGAAAVLCDLRGAGDSLHRIISTGRNDQEWCTAAGKQTTRLFSSAEQRLCSACARTRSRRAL